MAQTKLPPGQTPQSQATTSPVHVAEGEVFTLSEAAAYLRLSEEEILRMVREQGLAARQVGGEWRFLKSAIQEWLHARPGPGKGKDFWETCVGLFKDDPHLEEIVKDAYRQRGDVEEKGR